MRQIFISYRRQDSAPYAGRIYDHLSNKYGMEEVFMDIDTIRPGQDFVDVLQSSVIGADTLLAVIGPQWTQLRDDDGQRRLDDPEDFVESRVLILTMGRGSSAEGAAGGTGALQRMSNRPT